MRSSVRCPLGRPGGGSHVAIMGGRVPAAKDGASDCRSRPYVPVPCGAAALRLARERRARTLCGDKR